ncbi:MAG: GNAT family N-acetyltransferase [Blastococcus sp.]
MDGSRSAARHHGRPAGTPRQRRPDPAGRVVRRRRGPGARRLPPLAADPAHLRSVAVPRGRTGRRRRVLLRRRSGIDLHNRTAHLGVSLLPAFRGRAFGTDVVGVLCSYGFSLRGLHRLQVETLVDNEAMVRAATRAGFTREGVLRGSAWVDGAFVDTVVLGLLAEEWKRGA